MYFNRKIIILILIFIFIYTALFPDDAYVEEFERELDRYKSLKDTGMNILFYSTIVLLTGFTCGTTFSTLKSLDITTPKLSDPFIISSYCVVPVSAIVGVVAFFIWKNATDKYLETLRLRDRYYNSL
jgi:hypothetical protein